jgi:protein-tyrosine phosphatase
MNQGTGTSTPSLGVLFVCMGNICRSPTVEGVFRKALQERAPDLSIHVDSAGTHGYHVGEPPDPRAIEAAARRGIDLKALRARMVTAEDFERFDLILAMDQENREALLRRGPATHHHRVRLFLEFAGSSVDVSGVEVPDPYYGGPAGFERVLDLAEEAAEGLLEELRRMAARR